MRFGKLSLAVLVLGAGACQKQEAESGKDNIVHVADDDAQRQAAVKTAKDTWPFFKNNWKSIPKVRYSLKFELPTSRPGDYEVIWFTPLTIEGDIIRARCANEPADIPGLKLHDLRELNVRDLQDWMLIDGDKCYGGYTIEALEAKGEIPKSPLRFMPADLSAQNPR